MVSLHKKTLISVSWIGTICLSTFHLRHARYCDMDTEAALSLSFSFTSFVLSF